MLQRMALAFSLTAGSFACAAPPESATDDVTAGDVTTDDVTTDDVTAGEDDAMNPADEIPVACTLSADDLAGRRDSLVAGILARAERVTELPEGLRVELASEPGLLADLARFVEQERACCRFLRFALTAEPDGGPIVVEVTGPPGTGAFLRSILSG